MTPGDTSTIIGPKTRLQGEVSGTENLLVDGEVEGTIRLETSCLTVRPTGRVKATVVAQDIVVFGHMEGEIRVSGLLQLRGSAVVQGDVYAARLSIEDGATLRGKADPSRAAEGRSAAQAEGTPHVVPDGDPAAV